MMRRGITLIEVLVVLVIVGVVAALVIGAVGAVRGDARTAVSSANMRSHAQAFQAYTGDFAGQWPFFTAIGFGNTVLTGGGISVNGVSFFDAHRTWHVALADDYFNAAARSSVFHPPRYRVEDGTLWPMHTAYHYPCVFITDPRYWNEYTRIGPEQYGSTRADHVAFPSHKTLIVESWPFIARVRTPGDAMKHRLPIAACDGSVQRPAWDRRRNGYERGDGALFAASGAIHYTDAPPLLHTIDGVRGRDAN